MTHRDKYDCRYYPGQRCNHVWCAKVQGKPAAAICPEHKPEVIIIEECAQGMRRLARRIK